MDTQILDVCCGLDMHKVLIQACILDGKSDADEKVIMNSFGTNYDDLVKLSEWLKAHGCPVAAMESTGVYWLPTYNMLTSLGITCYVVNARHIKNVPGRKTDVKDAQWLANITKKGLITPSFVPDLRLQTYRRYTRMLETLTQERSNNINRIEKFLQENEIKLSSVLTDIVGTTGMRILTHIAKFGTISHAKIEQYRDAHCSISADNIFNAVRCHLIPEDCRLLTLCIKCLGDIDAQIVELHAALDEQFHDYDPALSIMQSIPCIGRTAAQEILGEIGDDMEVFISSERLAAWAGLVPRCDESAGKKSLHASCPVIDISSECLINAPG